VRWRKGGLNEDQMVMDVQMRPYTEYQVVQSSYRTGGQPLRDTGDLYRSLGAGASATPSQIKLAMQGNKYGLYHDRGFTTVGPIHYVPLTRKGARGHATGANPNAEGLVRGKDYMTIGSKKKPKGVTVPARPFILPLREDVLDLGRSIYLGLRSILRRT
jgi:phage gpG-like protein